MNGALLSTELPTGKKLEENFFDSYEYSQIHSWNGSPPIGDPSMTPAQMRGMGKTWAGSPEPIRGLGRERDGGLAAMGKFIGGVQTPD